MSDQYIGEIRLLPYLRGAPEAWQICDGSLLQIANYPALYQLLGTIYGGDGQQTFGVPDLRGRVPIHKGNGLGLAPRQLGEIGGSESVTLTIPQMAAHNHIMLASATPGNSENPANAVVCALAASRAAVLLAVNPPGPAGFPFTAAPGQNGGSSQPHDNTAPTATLQYCIALEGVFPPRQ